jgi:preprotein translocase subunit Sss1
MFAEALSTKLEFKPCPADPDVWIRPAKKPTGEEYYEYILVYVDDILILSHNPQTIMDRISQSFTVKKGSDREPDTYLGADVGKFEIEGDPVPKWSLGADKYIQNAVNNVTEWPEREQTDREKMRPTDRVQTRARRERLC